MRYEPASRFGKAQARRSFVEGVVEKSLVVAARALHREFGDRGILGQLEVAHPVEGLIAKEIKAVLMRSQIVAQHGFIKASFL
jgi:hypothetical protein